MTVKELISNLLDMPMDSEVRYFDSEGWLMFVPIDEVQSVRFSEGHMGVVLK